jgi:glycosyltransferase involved in cell wall biosynthesis
MRRPPLTVLVPCYNNQDIIETCLRSVSWADEVLLCDSYSTDRTLELARSYVHRIIRRAYDTSACQKNWAIPQASHPWVLIVDTDERVTPQLRAEIECALADATDIAGFLIPRANVLFGRWLRHGDHWPDYQLRLFRRDLGRYDNRAVHAHLLLDGPTGVLRQPLEHVPHRSLRNLYRVILCRYTAWEAMEKRKRGVRFRWRHLVVRPAGCFLYRYLFRRGFLDGWQGLLMASVWSWYVFITYSKLRHLERTGL